MKALAGEQPKGKSLLCEECNSNAYKYKCPACFRRTCSLSCVNSHKQISGCTGKRDRTQFLTLAQFDDSTLLSDYNMLEDVKRVAESAKRTRWKLGAISQLKLPDYLKALRNIAGRRRTKLLFLPTGMSKRKKNKTRICERPKSISWTIEWRFHSVDVVLLEHGVRETSTLRSVVEKHLQPSPWRNKLRRFCEEDMDNLKFFICKYQGSKAPYRELDLDTPLSKLFAKLVILEYPVIHIFLSSDKYDFEVVRDIIPCPISAKSVRPEAKRDESPPPTGTVFKEEEIIEDEKALEPQIIDLLKCSGANEYKPTSQDLQAHVKNISDSSSSQLVIGLQSNSLETNIAESDEAFAISDDREVELIDANLDDFDFDQDLIDAYSFLLEESNPDDFLDFNLEGGVDDLKDTDLCFLDVDDDELEEGEIPAGSD